MQLPRKARLELCVVGHGPGKIPKPPTPADGEGHGNEGGDEEVNILNLPLPEVNFDAFDGMPHASSCTLMLACGRKPCMIH